MVLVRLNRYPMENAQPTSKERYQTWCSQQPNLPVFMQPWWMDAVCAGKQWDVLLYINEKTDVILAAMPYLLRKRFGIRYILMPQLTQIGGIWFDHTLYNQDGSIWDKDLEQQVYQSFANRLKDLNLAYYYQQFPLQSTAPESLQKLGFTSHQRLTYRLDDLTNLDDVIEQFSKNKKRQLQKALSLHAERGLSVEMFYRLHEQCLKEKKKHISYTREFLLVLDRKAKRAKQSEIISIHNADGEIYAAAYLVWDNRSMYYLIPFIAERHRDSGAGALLVLESIKFAREKHLAFDFEGSMVHSIANHYHQFGSTPTPYYSVHKYYHWWFIFAIGWQRLRTWFVW